MVQSVKHLTLVLSSSHDLTVCEFKPRIRLYANGVEPTLDYIFPSLCSSPACSLSLLSLSLSLSLKINKLKKPKEVREMQIHYVAERGKSENTW